VVVRKLKTPFLIFWGIVWLTQGILGSTRVLYSPDPRVYMNLFWIGTGGTMLIYGIVQLIKESIKE
jgi:hypothetical protein